MTRTAVFDIETNGLLHELNAIHSLCIKTRETGEVISCTNSAPAGTSYVSLEDGIRALEEADLIVGHNIISFDIPAIQKLYPSFKPKGRVFDTLVASLLIWSDMKERDYARRDTLKRQHGETRMNQLWPGTIIGRHGLDAWGIRLGVWKGDYAKVRAEELKSEFHRRHMAVRETGKKVIECPPKVPSKEELTEYVWGSWNQPMQDYCEQDIEVTDALYALILSKNYSQEALELEHDFKTLACMMEREGYSFDVKGAEVLERKLTVRLAEIQQELQGAFPPWEERTPFVPKVNNAKMGYKAGVPTFKTKTVVFNPASRDHIASRLTAKYGWEPTEFTETGKPQVDESTLEVLTYPEAPLLNEGLMIGKRLGQLSEGNQAWLKLVTPEGRIHHEVVTNGAITGRCTHKRPNVAQTPSSGAPYGAECRSLWGPPRGMKQVGADLSGLELRCLAHFMAVYDDGAYSRELLEGDIHTANQLAAGLPTRENAKTFIYGFLYGAGAEKIGEIVNGTAADGKRLINSFLEKTPAIKKLREKVEKLTARYTYKAEQYLDKASGKVKTARKKVPNPSYRGYLIGLDGRQLPIRSPHAALNTLLQSAGALISKKATVILWRDLEARGYRFGIDWALMAHIHDEVQLWARPEIAEEVGKTCVAAFAAAGAHFKFRCPITGEYKIGDNWNDCH